MKTLSALRWGGLAAAGLGFASAVQVPVAQACGGLFCNTSQPVNQAAERILFVDHGDGSTTAVIEITYEGPSDRFAWVLPLGDIADPDKDIKVSSGMAFDRLQQRTNPSYTLNRTVEGECDEADFAAGFGGQVAFSGGSSSAPPPGATDAGVVVEASGSVGPFDYELISVTEGSADPADVAVKWLTDNDYDLGELGPDVLRPYLAENMKLLAVRLTKGNDAGAIRPLSIRYQGDKPSIPIRPTAVAANDDMGIMVWVAGPSRAVPVNYRDLTLNEALINWFNAGSTYNTVVTAAADEAGGQGFVTEFAGDSASFEGAVYFEDWSYQELVGYVGADYGSETIVQEAVWRFSSYDGFRDALKEALALPTDVTLSDVINCPGCYLAGAEPQVTLDANGFITALDEQVVSPLRGTESLLLSQPYVTRLYTTMSADEMSMDPLFDFNADLADLSNLHTADQVIECAPGYTQFDAPFRVELENGIVVHGTQQGTWPVTYDRDTMPANLKIAQVATSGAPKVMVDNVALIKGTLDKAAEAQGTDSAGTGGVLASGGDTAGSGGTQATRMGGGASICAVEAPGRGSSWAFLTPLAFASLWRARRRKGARAA